MEANGKTSQRQSPLIAAGIVLGLGLGGFIDGILLHQILQWHHMLSNVRSTEIVSELKQNTLGDGWFEAANWVLTVVGIGLLWRAGKRDDVPWALNTFIGALLMGWGIFDLVEGIIDHHILSIHHVKPGPNELAWDIGFLVFGAFLTLVGWFLIRSDRQETSIT